MKKMLGTIEVMTNRRITLPKKIVTALKAEDGDFLLFYQGDSEITVVREPGLKQPKEKKHKEDG